MSLNFIPINAICAAVSRAVYPLFAAIAILMVYWGKHGAERLEALILLCGRFPQKVPTLRPSKKRRKMKTHSFSANKTYQSHRTSAPRHKKANLTEIRLKKRMVHEDGIEPPTDRV